MIREHEVARWLMAAITVAAAHVGVIWAATSWQPAAPAPDMLEPAAMIELAALTLAPEAPWQEVAPGPQMAKAPPEKPPEPIEESVEEPELTQPEPAKAPLPEPQIKLPEPPAELPAIPAAEAALAPPKPLPPRMKLERKAPQKSAQRQPRRPREIAQQQRLSAPQTSAPISTEAARAERAAAPEMGSSATPSLSPATWRGQINAHLNRYRRAPPGSAAGTAQVAFTIDRAGRVLAARLVASSGNAELDTEAAAMIRRASPVPPPPTTIAGASITLVVPVKFSRQ